MVKKKSLSFAAPALGWLVYNVLDGYPETSSPVVASWKIVGPGSPPSFVARNWITNWEASFAVVAYTIVP